MRINVEDVEQGKADQAVTLLDSHISFKDTWYAGLQAVFLEQGLEAVACEFNPNEVPLIEFKLNKVLKINSG